MPPLVTYAGSRGTGSPSLINSRFRRSNTDHVAPPDDRCAAPYAAPSAAQRRPCSPGGASSRQARATLACHPPAQAA